ncbi:MAG TPA: carboxypeptidase M32 [Phycisphaerae bacterium]
MPNHYDALLGTIREIGLLESVESVLDWDQETFMPPNGLSARAEQLALVAALIHQRRTDPRVGELLAKAEQDGDPIRTTNVRETKRIHERAVRIPTELIARIARVSAHAKDAWAKARADSNFPAFVPHLSELLELKRQVADLIGYKGERYDALLDEYEPGATAADVAKVFAALREPLSAFVRQLAAARRQPDAAILARHFPRPAQERMCRQLAEAIGFDFKSGRIDTSTHPFCSGTTPGDVRLTTRYQEDYFPCAIFGTLHEAGHGLYEQGLDPAHMFTPMGKAVSLGIHESQSRMWENFVGRSRPFWERFYSEFQQAFPDALRDVSLETFVGSINIVRPSLIRVEADEVTYNLHIILRFEMERDMISGKLEVKDVPAAWNTKMHELLGIRPPNDREGCLQDIHWSMGAFGYFPTYALGNLYAAQFYAAAERQIGDLPDRLRRGDFGALRDWLRTNIHRHGQRYRSGELVKVVTGAPLTIEPFMNYIRRKFSAVYGL